MQTDHAWQRDIASPSRGVLGIDVGGANIKYADLAGRSRAVSFALWRHPERLYQQLSEDVAAFPGVKQLAATMTGELADCFVDRAAGVAHIVDHLCRAAEDRGLPPPRIYRIGGGLVDARCVTDPEGIAAANWHALATWAARKNPFGTGSKRWLLVDIGSTTADLVPVLGNQVATTAVNDVQRLAEGSLVYLGGQRTPVCSLVDSLQWQNQTVPVMRECFATMDDVRLLLGEQPENAGDHDSADGRPRDRSGAANRMARMIGLDHRSISIDQARALAEQVHRRAREILLAARQKLQRSGLIAHDSPLLISGHAQDLVASWTRGIEHLRVADWVGEGASRCGPALAVAALSDR